MNKKQELEEHYQRCEQLRPDKFKLPSNYLGHVVTKLPPGPEPEDLYSRYPEPKDRHRKVRFGDEDDFEEEELLTWQDIGSGWVSEYDIENISYLDTWEKMLLTARFAQGKTVKWIMNEFKISRDLLYKELRRIKNKLESHRNI